LIISPIYKNSFPGAPPNFQSEDLSHSDVPSIIDVLCQLFEGLSIETKIIRRQYLGSFVEELLSSEVTCTNTCNIIPTKMPAIKQIIYF
jgi:hypothetical protein